MLILINACNTCERDRAILTFRQNNRTLWNYLIPILESTFPGSEIIYYTNDSAIAELAETSCRCILQADRCDSRSGYPWLDTANNFIARSDSAMNHDDILILSPTEGVIGKRRMEHLFNIYQQKMDVFHISARKIPVNCHPSWLVMVPEEVWQQPFYIARKDFTEGFNREKYLPKEAHKFFPKAGEVLGSQYLPQLYEADGAIALISAQALIDTDFSDKEKWQISYLEPGEECDFLPYIAPTFQLSRYSRVNF